MAKIALLIGIGEYASDLAPLPGSLKDVEAMERILSNPELGGFEQVKILKNPEPLEMQVEIQEAFSSSRQKNDLALLFFSGHGVKDERGNLYLATRITRKTQRGELVKGTAVPASFVQNIMNDCRSRRQVVILDCCFSGAFAEGLLAKDDGTVEIRHQLGGEGRAILTSSTSTQYSFEQKDSELSIYTRFLVEGIETGIADRDNDGMIAVSELHEYAREKVQEAVPAMKPEIYAIKEGYTIVLTKIPLNDPKLSYRREVERFASRRFASRGQISLVGRIALDEQRKQLGLSLEETKAIEEEVLKPYREYQQKLQVYEQAFLELIEQGNLLGEITGYELNELQKILGLREEDVALIESRLKLPIAETVAVTSPPPSDREKSTPLDPAFLKRCQQELVRYIGPMASFIVKDTLAQNPQLTPQTLIDILAAEISNLQEAKDFKQILNSVKVITKEQSD